MTRYRLLLATLLSFVLSLPATAQITTNDGVAVQFYEGDDLLLEECGAPRFDADGQVYLDASHCRPEQLAVARRSGGQPGLDPNASLGAYHGSIVTNPAPATRPAVPTSPAGEAIVWDSRRAAPAPAVPVVTRAYDPHRVDPRDFKENFGAPHAPPPVVHRPAPRPAHQVVYTPRRIRDVFTPPRAAGCVQASACNPCSTCRSHYAHPTYATYGHGSSVEVIDTVPQDFSTLGYARLDGGLETGNAVVIDKRRVADPSIGGRSRTHYRYSLQIPGGRLAVISTDSAPIVGECVAYDVAPLSARLRVVRSNLCPVTMAAASDTVFVPGSYQFGVLYGPIGPGPYLGHGSYGGCQGAISHALAAHPHTGMARGQAMERASYVCALHGG